MNCFLLGKRKWLQEPRQSRRKLMPVSTPFFSENPLMHFSLMGFEQLLSSVLPSLGFSCLNFLSNQTEICIHISLSLTSGTVFFCFCWVKFRWMNAWLDYTRASVHSCRWNKGRIWGESKPSEYQRLSQN